METSPEPPPPTLLVPDMISLLGDSTGTQAIIRWWRHPVGTVLGFRLYKSTDGINWGSPILYEDSLTPQDTTVTIDSLETDQIYYFKMIALDTSYDAPESDFSNVYCFWNTLTINFCFIHINSF